MPPYGCTVPGRIVAFVGASLATRDSIGNCWVYHGLSESQLDSVCVRITEFLTVDDVAESLKLTSQTIRNWIDHGHRPRVSQESRRLGRASVVISAGSAGVEIGRLEHGTPIRGAARGNSASG